MVMVRLPTPFAEMVTVAVRLAVLVFSVAVQEKEPLFVPDAVLSVSHDWSEVAVHAAFEAISTETEPPELI
jgi:hypothetical protein